MYPKLSLVLYKMYHWFEGLSCLQAHLMIMWLDKGWKCSIYGSYGKFQVDLSKHAIQARSCEKLLPRRLVLLKPQIATVRTFINLLILLELFCDEELTEPFSGNKVRSLKWLSVGSKTNLEQGRRVTWKHKRFDQPERGTKGALMECLPKPGSDCVRLWIRCIVFTEATVKLPFCGVNVWQSLCAEFSN